MSLKRIIIYQNKILFNILNEIKSELNYEIENSDKGELAFNAMMRLMEKIDPSYKD
mgnify:CR=1 FL=1